MEKSITTKPEEIKKIVADVIAAQKEKGGVRNIFLCACGGSLGCFYPFNYLFKQLATSISCDSVSSNEFVHATPKSLGKNSVVFAMSLAGGTTETVQAAKVAKEAGATVVVLTAKEDAPLKEHCDYAVHYRIELDNVYDETNQALILNLAFEMLHQTEGFEYYEDAMDGMAKINTMCGSAAQKVKKRAEAWGRAMKEEPVIYTMGSGPSAFVAYIQSICMFMEMEWVNSASIHTGEYFHGPFEITDQNTPFMLFMSEGRTRPLDERALRFLERYAKKIEVLDAKELGVNIIKDTVAEFFNPVLHWTIGLEYAEGLAKAKQHPLMMRRYLGKVAY